jgi:hypothetical protein
MTGMQLARLGRTDDRVPSVVGMRCDAYRRTIGLR